jgi:hypothetical protein
MYLWMLDDYSQVLTLVFFVPLFCQINLQHTYNCVRFEVLSAVLLMIWVFWDVILCSWVSGA